MFEPISFFSSLVLATIQSLITSWLLLKLICLSNPNFLKALYISSGKSTTNARLLGGLSLSVAVFTSILSLKYFYPQILNTVEKNTLTLSLVSILLVTLYGYIDDKIEVRVRFKLIMQFSSVLTFAYFNASNISPNHPGLAFLISSIYGVALVNGTNLLDGLDTLSVKLGTASSLAFLYLGFLAKSAPSIYLSVALISALAMFYFFNREPAKVYMGEIGGSLIGLIYFIQSSMCYSQLKTQLQPVSAIALIVMAGFFPICELTVSFVRRIWGKKSPFRGDKLHLHYVLKNRYQLSASQVSTRMGLSAVAILSLGYIAAYTYSSVVGLIIVTLVTLQSYLSVCYKEWHSSYHEESADNVFKLFEGKIVNIIDSSQLGTLDISVSDADSKVSDKKKSA